MPYTPRLPPRAHQVEARQKNLKKPRVPSALDVFAYLMDMGTGKSKVVVDEFGERAEANDVSDLLMWAPAGCYRNWFEDRGEDELSELHKHMDPAVYDRTLIVPWISGGNTTDKRRLEAMLQCRDPKRPRAFVVNVEAMSAVKACRAAVKAFVETSRRGVIACIDESTTIKNHKAERTVAITDLTRGGKVAARRILTGLVTPQSPLDLFGQFDFLDNRILGFRSYRAFQARYAITRELQVGGQSRRFNPRIVVGYRNVEELREKIAPYSFRKLKEECLDLPPKQYLPIRHVELTAEQKRAYVDMRDLAIAELESQDLVTATMVLTQRLRLDQILCGFVTDNEGKLHALPEKRTAALLELLEDYQGKAIIWTTWDYSIRRIAAELRKVYGDDSVAMFWGGNRGTRDTDERRFKNDPKCRFMVATQSAGGRGNTWVGAGLSVYYNNNDNLEHRSQSEDRNHRDGLTGPRGAGKAMYADLVARGTIDERKIKNLRNKIDLASLISGDNYREWLI